MRDEAFALQLLSMAERWAGACGATLRDRKDFTATVFSVTRRPEERALLPQPWSCTTWSAPRCRARG